MVLKLAILICLARLSLSEDDSKWVWKGRRSDEPAGIRHSAGRPRYEVLEDGPIRPGDFRPPSDYVRPGRPIGAHQDAGFPDRPFFNRPGPGGALFVPNERPGSPGGFRPEGGPGFPPGGGSGFHPGGGPSFNPGGGPGFPPGGGPGFNPGGGGFHPGGGPHDDNPGILTGPVPSWVKEPPFKNFDQCKCAAKFNCNSPGISYGQCDVGKQYCCFHSKKNGALGGALPSRPIHSPENGVLIGPGGPVDFPDRPHRPHRPRPPHYGGIDDGGNGVLVGPGGPTGIIGRPPKGPFGPFNRPDLGPGGPHGDHFRPSEFDYGPRNAKDRS